MSLKERYALLALFFAADKDDVAANLIRSPILGVLDLAVAVKAGRSCLEFPGLSGEATPYFS